MRPLEVACPTGRCPGVLRYDLTHRTNGYLAACEPSARSASPQARCGRRFRWDAVREEWKRTRTRTDLWRWLGVPSVDVPWPV
ncbi:MAG TPA: hypothetical protein VGL60_01750 [Acidimicrobiales bacterium]|jgi:hypothetical protein